MLLWLFVRFGCRLETCLDTFSVFFLFLFLLRSTPTAHPTAGPGMLLFVYFCKFLNQIEVIYIIILVEDENENDEVRRRVQV
ncbi:MAG: hypothetical protein ACI8RD_008192 [Bacillariaceae sp.]|jgi:hypothetical protein